MGDRLYDAMIGVGGIGTGSFFALNGNNTLGREESRTGHYLSRRDYCKLHIISHYVKALLGPDFCSIPIGKVGDDEPGERLMSELFEAGLQLDHVKKGTKPTLFSFCFIYPDGSGGNMTTDNSACGEVDEEFVRRAESEMEHYRARGIALAAPEAPMSARAEMLRLGTKHGLFRVASFVSEEIQEAKESGFLSSIDVLALNIDEAAALGETNDSDPAAIVESAIRIARSLNPALLLTITAGAAGSWSWDGSVQRYIPAFSVDVRGTTGAGDAHLAGVIAGVALGLPFLDSHMLGALSGTFSVTSPDTINKDLNRRNILELAATLRVPVSEGVLGFLEANK